MPEGLWALQYSKGLRPASQPVDGSNWMIKSETGETGDKRVTRFTRLSEWQEARRVKCGLLDTLHAIHLPRLLALPVDNFGI
jgi:hypothetical protein